MKSKVVFAGIATAGMVLTGCGGSDTVAAAACDGEITVDTVTMFAHEGSEADAISAAIDGFNSGAGSDLGLTVDLTLIPEGNYTDNVNAAAASGDLPDIIDHDGPNMSNLAWAGNLSPLDECMPDDLRDNVLPSLIEQGTYADQLWSVGSFDSGLGLYAWRSALEEAGARIPEGIDDAWTAEEFRGVLEALQGAGYDTPLDPKFWYGSQGEWFSYAYQPVVWSAGGDLVTREGDLEAEGVLNSAESVSGLETFQGWIEDGLVDTAAADDSNFLNKEAPISWVGHWMYQAYKDAAGDDLVVLPLPDFGTGTKTGMGSWAWAMSSTVEDPDAAWAVIEYLMSDEVIGEITTANGAVPGTQTAIDASELYGEGGDLRLFVEQLQAAPDVAVPRPLTPAYPTITSEFRTVIDDVIQGADVQETLDAAAAAIDEDIAANEGYPPPS
jgi:multiple sugar transport system substrate-binding protein